jgi:hypothetical protein
MSAMPREQSATPIGVIWMEQDRNIVVRIRAEDDQRIGEINRLVSPRDPKYNQVIAYAGGLNPGEAKQLYQWDFALTDGSASRAAPKWGRVLLVALAIALALAMALFILGRRF